MILVPPGRFDMGSRESIDQLKAAFPVEAAANAQHLKFEGEWPLHKVTITRPFYLGEYEVTKREFKQFVEEAGFRTDAERSEKGGTGFTFEGDKLLSWGQRSNFTWRDWGVEQPDDAPVVNISHNDAAEFCVWLSKKRTKELSIADRGGMGICVSRGNDGALLQRRRSGTADEDRERARCDVADAASGAVYRPGRSQFVGRLRVPGSGGPISAEQFRALRYVGQRLGTLRGLVR